jgi:hypothetical protein
VDEVLLTATARYLGAARPLGNGHVVAPRRADTLGIAQLLRVGLPATVPELLINPSTCCGLVEVDLGRSDFAALDERERLGSRRLFGHRLQCAEPSRDLDFLGFGILRQLFPDSAVLGLAS